MYLKKRLKKTSLIVLSTSIILSGIITGEYTTNASTGSPNSHSISAGFINVDKSVTGTSDDNLQISGNPDINSGDIAKMFVADVAVDGYVRGRSNVFNIYTSGGVVVKDENGYPYLDNSEISGWATIMGGNPGFMTSANGLFASTILGGKNTGFSPYNAYLLSRIASMSGGKGEAISYTLKSGADPNTKDSNQEVYYAQLNFKTTPRPKGDIGVGSKTNYNVGETVPINFWAEDYSYYDRGIKVLNYYIYNLDTGQVEVPFSQQIKDYPDPRGDSPAYGGTASPYNLTIGGQSFVPTKPGHYEARLLITDLHARNSQNAPSVDGVGVPYTKQFTVGGGACTPIQGTLKISGQSDQTLTSGGTYKLPQGKNTINSLVFPVPGTLKIGSTTVGTNTTFGNILMDTNQTATFTPTDTTKCEWTYQFLAADPIVADCANCKGVLNVQTYTTSGRGELNTVVASGGLQFVATDADYLRIETSVPGKWYDASGNVIPMSAYVTSTSYTDLSFSQSSLTLKFVSNDGTYCWCKTIQRNSPTTEHNSCPNVYREGKGSLEDGDVISDIPLGGSLKLSATYRDTNNDTQPANLYWVITKPDGKTAKQVWIHNEDNGSWHLSPSSRLYLPIDSSYSPTDQEVVFDKAGTYTISYSYDYLTGQPYDDWRTKNCKFTITVNIVDTSNASCSDFSYAVDVDGQSTAFQGGDGSIGSPYIVKVPKGEKNETFFQLLYKGNPNNFGFFELKYTHGGTYGDVGVWPPGVSGVGSWGPGFFYEFGPDKVTYPEFSLVAYPRDKENCKTYFKIIWGDPIQFDCSKVYLAATVNGANEPLTGDGDSASPYRMDLLLNKDYTIDFRALFNKNGVGTTDRFETVTWELTNGKGTTYVGTGNTYTRSFKETAAVTYTLKLRGKGKGQSSPCPDKIVIIDFRTETCKDLTIQYKFSDETFWSKSTGDQITTPNNSYAKVVDGNKGLQIAVTTDTRDPSSQNQVTVSWTVTEKDTGKTIANESGSPTLFFEKNKIPGGNYLVKIKVTDTANPAFTNCELYIGFSLTDKNSNCSQFFLHVFAYNKGQDYDQGKKYLNENGKTINLDKSTDFYFITVSQNPDDLPDEMMNLDWQVPSPWVATPVFSADEKKWAVYQKDPVPNGTYKITGRLNDNLFTAKCNFEVTIVIGDGTTPEEPPPCTTCNPGGGLDGGKMKLKVYDSDNRLLVSTADGVWEREPARIEVEIDQTRLNDAFAKVDSEIKKAIDDKKAELLAKYPAPDYEKVKVTVTPETWNSKTNPKTNWPGSTALTVTGPGTNRNFLVNPKLEKQSHMYGGTIIPTLTTWNQTLNSSHYVVQTDSFVIEAPYQVNFAATYEKCEEIDDPNWVDDPDNPDDKAPKIKKCTPGSVSESIGNQFQINVQGDQTSFEVYEPNATGSIAHTAEWTEYHARDRYAGSKPNDFYAGERILARVEFMPKHIHPFSKQYPKINTASAWIYETGKLNTSLQSLLQLQAYTTTQWKGPQQAIAKLGMREAGVDTSLMGDKQKGFQKGESYAVYFQVQFAYEVQKGFAYGNKTGLLGHTQPDYQSVFHIIANAWERQGIRNHTKE